eukprot:NODE_1570_length_1900_cov_179.343275_g1330_i0.p1 GENE.NODE_1570_length_1900_cov_179.343275_g1330_i0~~NODE_1570_length_1900_cov_179.343275_g1330_i0.p1  ORF type:complete len:538 (+),score=181.19 NODE_1570_length_1900_cov_179.343275_g1330_i0:106-1719(+)
MAEGKKGKKKATKQSLSEFLGDKPAVGSWADDEVEFIPEEKHHHHESGARNSSSWRGEGGSQEQPRHFQSNNKLPDSPPFSIHIGNLSYEAKESAIADFFEVPESAVRLVRDRNTNQFKGFGYVEFGTKEELTASLSKNGELLQGRAIRIEPASENRGGRGGDRGGDRGGRGGFRQFGGDRGSGGFDNVGGGGRDWMGTATSEAAPERERGSRGGGFRNFEGRGGFDRDRGGRDSWRDSDDQERQPPAPSASGRDSSWRDSEDRRQARPTPSFTRDAMGSENAPATFSRGDDEGGRGRGRGRGFAARNSGDTWAEGRDAMGTGVVEERPPPRARPEREGLSRESMQTDASPEPNERQEKRPFRGRGGLSFSTTNVPSREGFGADRVPERKTDKWRDSNEDQEEGEEKDESKAHDNEETEETEEVEQPTPPRPKRAPVQASNASPARPSPKTSAPAPPAKAKKAAVPLTPQELFAQQQQKELRKLKQQEEANKQQKPQQQNANPWEALNKTKKKKNKNKKKATTEEGEEDGEEVEVEE